MSPRGETLGRLLWIQSQSRKQNRQTRDYELIVGRWEVIGAIGQRVSSSSSSQRAGITTTCLEDNEEEE